MPIRLKVGRVAAFAFQPVPSAPRDLVAEATLRESFVIKVGRALPVISTIALGVFIAKLFYLFNGNLSYVLAVLERISLSQAALFVTLSLAYAGSTYGILFAVSVITSPNFNSRVRRTC